MESNLNSSLINYVTLKKSPKGSWLSFLTHGIKGLARSSVIACSVIVVMFIISRCVGGVRFPFYFGILRKVKDSSNRDKFTKQASLSFSLHTVCI